MFQDIAASGLGASGLMFGIGCGKTMKRWARQHFPWEISLSWHVYLIECADGSLYTGITTDVERRFHEHLAGKGARYTRSHKPLRIVASCPVGSRSQALRAERAIKQQPPAKKMAALLSLVCSNPEGNDCIPANRESSVS